MNRQNRSHLVKGLTTLALLAVLLASYQGLNMAAFSGDYYAPGAAAPMQEAERVLVCGRVVRWNDINFQYDAVVNESVRLWATDELIENNVITDSDGYYKSYSEFRTGQLIAVTVLGERYTRFISYHAEVDYELEAIIIE